MRYVDHDVIHGIDMQIGDGEFVVIVGPSGCGKSTLLRMVAGLEAITSGEVLIDGHSVRGDTDRRGPGLAGGTGGSPERPGERPCFGWPVMSMSTAISFEACVAGCQTLIWCEFGMPCPMRLPTPKS